ncbi:hypothetical protein V1505DRAFT_379849, partial [Lipomyces doorenjongii]
MPTHYARDIKDVYSVSRPGYSFLTDPMNRLTKQYLWDKMVSTPTLQSQFMDADGIMSRPARAYLKNATQYLEVLFILMHVTYGSPARMTEINTWTHANSVHGSRSIYCHSRG